MDNKLVDIVRLVKENPYVLFFVQVRKNDRYYVYEYLYDESQWFYYKNEGWVPKNKIEIYTFFEKLKFIIYNTLDKSICNIYGTYFTHKELSAKIILRYWKKYRWNYLQNLAEKKYHPDRLLKQGYFNV